MTTPVICIEFSRRILYQEIKLIGANVIEEDLCIDISLRYTADTTAILADTTIFTADYY